MSNEQGGGDAVNLPPLLGSGVQKKKKAVASNVGMEKQTRDYLMVRHFSQRAWPLVYLSTHAPCPSPPALESHLREHERNQKPRTGMGGVMLDNPHLLTTLEGVGPLRDRRNLLRKPMTLALNRNP